MPATVELDDAKKAALIALLKQIDDCRRSVPAVAAHPDDRQPIPTCYRGVSVSCSSSSAISS
jgi:hypothetical protein